MHEVNLCAYSLVYWEDELALRSPTLRLPIIKEGRLHYTAPELFNYAFTGAYVSEAMIQSSNSWLPGYFVLRLVNFNLFFHCFAIILLLQCIIIFNIK